MPSPAARRTVRLSDFFSDMTGALLMVASVSAVLNILALSGSFFMLLVYDRVLPSHSLATLGGLFGIVLILYAFQAVLEVTRQRLMVEIASSFDNRMSGKVFDLASRAGAVSGPAEGLQISRDLDQLRSLISGNAVIAAFDMPWMLLYIGICFMFHWMIGVAALVGAATLLGLTLATERLTQKPIGASGDALSRRNAHLLVGLQNIDVARSMGMEARFKARWEASNEEFLESQERASDLAGGLAAATRTFRMFLQSSVLALGAFLVIQQQATGGVIIASSILTTRALAPIEQAIANIKNFIAARQSWARLKVKLDLYEHPPAPTALPAPRATVALEGVTVVAPRSGRPLVQDVSFGLNAGAGLAVIGASGSGKSTLAKAIAGAWAPYQGKVRLDGASLDQWPRETIGEHIGYLPQNVQLLSGTIAANIARFDPNATSAAVVAAAQSAGVHDLIVRLPQGYETQVGIGGVSCRPVRANA